MSLNTLAIEIPKIVYRNIGVKQNRNDRLVALDEIEQSKHESTSGEEQIDEDSSDMEIILKLNTAFKTIEILGQILKNYHGSMEGETKNLLTAEAFMIGLRVLNSILSLVSDNIDALAAKFQRIIEQQDETLTKAIIQEKSRILLFNLCTSIAYGTILKITEAVGEKGLYSTYNEIVTEYNTVAVKLINISIRLDQSRSIPFNDIKYLQESLEKNMMGERLLKLLVVNHLHMFDSDHTDKSRICNLLGIPIQKQLQIEMKEIHHR